MASFLIYRKQPKLHEIHKSLVEGNLNPNFQEVDDLEFITLTIAEGGLDVIISFNHQNHRVNCQVVTVSNQSQFAYYESFFHQAVTGKELLGWWFTTCRDISSRVEAARAIELAFA
jgi:hypothetical protein